MRPGLSKKCGFLLPKWRDAIRSLTVDAAAYESVLGALSIEATVWEYMEIAAALGSTLLQKCGDDLAYVVSAVGSRVCTPHVNVTRVRH